MWHTLPDEITEDMYVKSISKVVEEGLWQCEGKYRRGNYTVAQKDYQLSE